MRTPVCAWGRVVFFTLVVILTLLVSPALAGNTVSVSGEILSAPAPVAAFSGSTATGTAPLSVTFDASTSTGTITSYAWDFNNDGTMDLTTTGTTASFTYTTAGTYTVKLTVTGPGGSDSEVKTDYITVSALVKPVAAFTATPTSGYNPLTVQFTDQSTNTPTSWKWEYRLGSGSWTQFSTARNPSYIFSATGSYSIRLTATNARGSNTLTRNSYITVATAVRPPVARFTMDKAFGRAPLTVHFTDRSLNNPTSYSWQFGDGITSGDKNPVHTYTRAGIYPIEHRVSNAAGSDITWGTVVVFPKWWW